MRINHETQTFEDLTQVEAWTLQSWVERVVVKGEAQPVPEEVLTWLRELGYDRPGFDHSQLLILSTVAPQRVLLSLLWREQRGR